MSLSPATQNPNDSLAPTMGPTHIREQHFNHRGIRRSKVRGVRPHASNAESKFKRKRHTAHTAQFRFIQRYTAREVY